LSVERGSFVSWQRGVVRNAKTPRLPINTRRRGCTSNVGGRARGSVEAGRASADPLLQGGLLLLARVHVPLVLCALLGPLLTLLLSSCATPASVRPGLTISETAPPPPRGQRVPELAQWHDGSYSSEACPTQCSAAGTAGWLAGFARVVSSVSCVLSFPLPTTPRHPVSAERAQSQNCRQEISRPARSGGGGGGAYSSRWCACSSCATRSSLLCAFRAAAACAAMCSAICRYRRQHAPVRHHRPGGADRGRDALAGG
jgi:hypothetical protein